MASTKRAAIRAVEEDEDLLPDNVGATMVANMAEYAIGNGKGRTDPITVGLEAAQTIFAAWDKFYWVFGARVENIVVTPDGVILEGLSFPDNFNVDQIIADISSKNHRIDLIPAHFWANGATPEKPTDSTLLSFFVTNWFSKSMIEGRNRSPMYALFALAQYKVDHGLKAAKGKKIVQLDPMNFDPASLAEIPMDELQPFLKAVEAEINRRVEIRTA